MKKYIKKILSLAILTPTLSFVAVSCSKSENNTNTQKTHNINTQNPHQENKDNKKEKGTGSKTIKKPIQKVTNANPKNKIQPKQPEKTVQPKNGQNTKTGTQPTKPLLTIISSLNLWKPMPTDYSNDKQDSKQKSQDIYELHEGSVYDFWFDKQTKNLSSTKHYTVSISQKKYLKNGSNYILTYTANANYRFDNGATTITKTWTPTKLAKELSKDSIIQEIMNSQRQHVVVNNKNYIEFTFPDKSNSGLIFFDGNPDGKMIDGSVENVILLEAEQRTSGAWGVKHQDQNFYVIPSRRDIFFVSSDVNIKRNWIVKGLTISL